MDLDKLLPPAKISRPDSRKADAVTAQCQTKCKKAAMRRSNHGEAYGA